MNGTLKLNSNIQAYADIGETSNPTKRYVDWSTKRSYPVKNPKSDPHTVDPGASLTLFSGIRSTSIDNTTEFALSLSTLASDRYRFAWTGVGTAPALRTNRGLTLATHAVTMTANANLTLTMAATAGDFTNVQVGDTVFLPDTTTGDAASPFSPLNTGYWFVLSKSLDNGTLQLSRPIGSSFLGYSEVVTVVSNPQVVAFSAAGVQVGDSVNISAGFNGVIPGTYAIVAVTATWFEVIATQPLPISATAVPGVAGMIFYTDAKRYIRVEADQFCIVRLNGDTSDINDVTPWSAGDPEQTGWFEKCGPCWSAVVVNKSSSPLNIYFISAE
jgi:hypothetical protein